MLLTRYYSYAEIKKNGMGVACSSDVGEERCLEGFGGGKLMERGHLEDLSVDERILLRWIFRNWDESVDWIDLAQDGEILRTW